MVFHRFLQPSESMGSSKVNIDFPDFPEKYESWWLMVVDRPLWKIWVRQLGWLFPIYGEIKNVPNHQPVLISFCPWIPRNCLGSSKAAFTMDLAAASAASLEETSALTSLGRTKSLMEIWGIGPSTSYRVFHGFLGISKGGFLAFLLEFSWYFSCNPNWIQLIVQAKTHRHLIKHCALQISEGYGLPLMNTRKGLKIFMITMTNLGNSICHALLLLSTSKTPSQAKTIASPLSHSNSWSLQW